MLKTSLTMLCALAILTVSAHAATVVPVNLEEMVDGADRIFVGRALTIRRSTDPVSHLPVRYTTFDVIRAIKGDLGATVTIKQLASDVPGQVSVIPGTPFFPIGKEYVLFLHKDSSIGFTNPVGLFQGRLPVVTERDGTRTVVGPFTSSRLLSGLQRSWIKSSVLGATRRAATLGVPAGGREVDYGQFVDVLDRMVQTR